MVRLDMLRLDMLRLDMVRVRWVLLALAVLCLGCQKPRAHISRLEGEVMGTTWHASIVTPEAQPQDRLLELQAEIQQALDDVDRKMSTYKPDSEISRFNQHPSTDPMPVSEETLHVTREALRIAAASDGALDPTIAPLVDLWGFGPTAARSSLPSDEEISQHKGQVGWQHLDVSNDTRLAKELPALSLDLSAVAKGHAVDRAAAVLIEAGAEDFLIEVGGELTTRGRNGQGEGVAPRDREPASRARRRSRDALAGRALRLGTRHFG